MHYDEEADARLQDQVEQLRFNGQFKEADRLEQQLRQGDPIFGQYQRTPTEKANNAVQNAADKLFELSWVYTVIAGVLNIMVIYDAMAGPAFPPVRQAVSTPVAA
jgi:hypothetical protein